MEECLWDHCFEALSDQPLSLQMLASVRSLAINPSTSDATISAILETLVRSLQLNFDETISKHIVKVLLDVALRKTHVAHHLFDSIRACSFSRKSTRLAAESLSALISIAEQEESSISAMAELEDSFFVSLCFRSDASVRCWLLSNADKFCVRPYLLLTVLLGFTKDPYPNVRRIALDGLVNLGKYVVCEDRDMIAGCYGRAVELLYDMEDAVRCAAVCAVSAWGRRLVASYSDLEKVDCSDALFVQVGRKKLSMILALDMNMDVRVRAFEALGSMKMVSDDILLQTLSKKVPGKGKEQKSISKGTALSSAAGAFLHGLEDEFHEVRRSASHSLRSLTILSPEFASGASNLLIDLLNDDSTVVRLQALETMHHMAACNCLKLQETHTHMFMGTLVDNDTLIRSSTRKVLRTVKFPTLAMFKSSVDGFIRNLEACPEDETDVSSALFDIGRNHGNFTMCITQEFSTQIGALHEGELELNNARVVALLVLAISAPFSQDKHGCSLPTDIYSCALTLLGRISRALSDITNQETLLAYFSKCSKPGCPSAWEPEKEEVLLPEFEGDNMHVEVDDEVSKCINYIVEKFKDIWLLIQSGCITEVLRTLRSFKEELTTLNSASPRSAGSVVFMLQYTRSLKLLAKACLHFPPARKPVPGLAAELGIILQKLDGNLKEMRHRFAGLSREEEIHVMELMLLTNIMNLSNFETDFKGLATAVSRVELLYREGSMEPSNFLMEFKRLAFETATSEEGYFCDPSPFRKHLESFLLRQFVFSGGFKHIKAELGVRGCDSENPLPYISGLPVGIPFEITLHNVPDGKKLWLRMTAGGERREFAFLDLEQFEGCDGIRRRLAGCIPFYRTPKVFSFTLRASIGMECLFEDGEFVARRGGGSEVEHKLIFLCPDVEVYFRHSE